jgi:hypothetical protein
MTKADYLQPKARSLYTKTLPVIARPEAEAIQPQIRYLTLDCFAALAMTG